MTVFRVPVIGNGRDPAQLLGYRPKYGRSYRAYFYKTDFTEVVVDIQDPQGISDARADPAVTELPTRADVDSVRVLWGL